MRQLSALIIAVITGFSAGALAASQAVYQKGRVFSATSLTIKKGTAVTFINDDTVPHNIYSESKNNEFNLGAQAPGTSTDVTFDQAGQVKIMCAIHPRMMMTVQVEN